MDDSKFRKVGEAPGSDIRAHRYGADGMMHILNANICEYDAKTDTYRFYVRTVAPMRGEAAA